MALHRFCLPELLESLGTSLCNCHGEGEASTVSDGLAGICENMCACAGDGHSNISHPLTLLHPLSQPPQFINHSGQF